MRSGLALVAALLLPLAVQAAVIERSQATVPLPPGRSVLSPYLNPTSGAMVLHVQPVQAGGSESLFDARSGRPWEGDLPALLRDFGHLGTERMADVASGQAVDLALLRALGCTAAHVVCTSLQDADVLLLAAPTGRNQLALTVIDLRALLAEMEDVLAGRRAGSELRWGDDEWRVFEVVAQRPERRARWSDAVRSIGSIDAFQQVLTSATEGPRLAARPLFSGARAVLDLRAELELLGHRLLVGAQAARVLDGGGPSALAGLADALESATRPPNPVGVATHLVDLLAVLPDAQRAHLASGLAGEASRRRSEVLLCFGQWLGGKPCGDGAPPWLVQPAAAAVAVPPPPPRVAQAGSAQPVQAPQPAAATPPPAAVASVGTDAPFEWTQIQRVPNKLVLVAFNEASGRLERDRAVVGGFSFVARALGPVQDGRFEVEVAANDNAPVRLRHGQYRVRARLVLDYTREDQCVQGMSCWFSRPELHAKSVPRDVVFFMTISGRFTDRRRAEFGTLLPLVADGPARYRSQLKEVRLAIESVRFELL